MCGMGAMRGGSLRPGRLSIRKAGSGSRRRCIFRLRRLSFISRRAPAGSFRQDEQDVYMIIMKNLVNPVYSLLNATIGSTRVARRAGIRQASNATTNNTIDTPANVSGSVGDTP